MLMNYTDQTINSIDHTRIQLFFFSFLTAGVHLSAAYFLLTVNNPFNFNNNFHLIGFISFVCFMSQLLLTLVLGRLIHQKALHMIEEGIIPDDPFQGLSSFIILLVMLFFTILPPLIYFLLINEFMPSEIKPVFFGLLGVAGATIIFSYWIAITSFFKKQVRINWWNLFNKLIVLIIFGLIFIILINFLTGIIPAEPRPVIQPYFSL